MSDDGDDAGTLTPEVRMRQMEARLADETERLVKLYDAYEQQEKEIVSLRAEIEVLEKDGVDKAIEIASGEDRIKEKNNRIEDLEKAGALAKTKVETLEPALEKMEERFTREKERLSRVFEIAEELDGDLRLAVAEMKARDDWYVSHMQVFEDLNRAIKTRYEMIENAVEAERKSAHMKRAIREQFEDAEQARADDAAEAADEEE